MPSWIVDLSVLVLILGMTYALASEGLWGAVLMFFNSLFAGMIAFNFYEPLATLLATNVEPISGYADTLCLMVLYLVSLLILRLATEYLAPMMVRYPAPIYHIGRWLFGFLASCVTMAILLLAFHTSPVHKKMFGAYAYDLRPPFGMGLDWQWLGFFQHTTGQIFATYRPDGPADPFREYGTAKVFDPYARWLIDHQNARPYGEDFVPPPLAEGAAGAEGAGAGGAPGAMPGMPGGAAGGGPGIPGGTAGAAAGLAPTNL
jgi:uncharacterized membrane protein required for colicin V production